MNEELLVDEDKKELVDLMRNIANDLNATIKKFKEIAKAKGIRYKIAASKKDAIESSITGKSLEGGASKGDLMKNVSKANLSSLHSGSDDGGNVRKSKTSGEVLVSSKSVANVNKSIPNAMLVEETDTQQDETESSHHPASRKAESEKEEDVVVEDNNPAEFSNDEDSEEDYETMMANRALNK